MSTRALYSCVLVFQAIESAQSYKSGCPFPLPGWRQGPSGDSICYSLLVNVNQKFLQEDQKEDQPFYSVWGTAHWKLQQQFSWKNPLL